MDFGKTSLQIAPATDHILTDASGVAVYKFTAEQATLTMAQVLAILNDINDPAIPPRKDPRIQ